MHLLLEPLVDSILNSFAFPSIFINESLKVSTRESDVFFTNNNVKKCIYIISCDLDCNFSSLLTFVFISHFPSDAHGANRRTRESRVPRTTIRLDIVGRLVAGSLPTESEL